MIERDQDIGSMLIADPADVAVDLNTLLGHLVARITNGETAAFNSLHAATCGIVLGAVRRIVRDTSDAEEIASDIYQQVWRNAGSYRGERSSVLTWLLVISRSRALDHLRRSGRRIPSLSAFSQRIEEGESSYSLDETSAHFDAPAIAHALDSLKAVQRNVVRMSYCDGMSGEQISTRLALPLGTVKSHARRGLLAMRLTLGVALSVGPVSPAAPVQAC